MNTSILAGVEKSVLNVKRVLVIIAIALGLGTLPLGCTALGPGTFSYSIDTKIVPLHSDLPGLNGGLPRRVGVAVGPDGSRDEFVVNEVVFHPTSQADLKAFLAKYNGTVLRDGKPHVLAGVQRPAGLPESTGWYLIHVDLSRSLTDDLVSNMNAAGLSGQTAFSSEGVARLAALVVRERGREISPNFLGYGSQCYVCEHPDGAGGHLDAASWWWINMGYVRQAWEYVKYMGFPPVNTPFYPITVAIIDGGFDLDQTNGAPLNGNIDYRDYLGRDPLEINEVDSYWSAGGPNPNQCTGGKKCDWHGQMVFGAALAQASNNFGSAGTGAGGAARTLLIKVDGSYDSWGSAVYDAVYNGADVVNMSMGGQCGWWCKNVAGYSGYGPLKSGISGALNYGSIVVAAAGNDGQDISNVDYVPCKLNGVVCVGASATDGSAESKSNYGWIVDIWAPDCFKTTVTRDSAATASVGMDALATACGTSAASPYVAGVVALMKMLDKSLTYDQVRNILKSTAQLSADSKVKPGYVNALAAVEAVKAITPLTVQIHSPASGEELSYRDSVSFYVEVKDPQVPSPIAVPYGFSPTSMASFSSDRDGPLCSTGEEDATGNGAILGCAAPKQLSIGTHVITATVNGPFGSTASASIPINVINHPPFAKITYPLGGSTFNASQQIHLQGYGFDFDETISDNQLKWSAVHQDGLIHIWFQLGTGRDLWVSLEKGTYTVSLVATDSLGATGSDNITVNVQEATDYPTAQILLPANNSIFGLGKTIAFQGHATDPVDGQLIGSSLSWYSDVDGFLGTGNSLQTTLSGATCHTIVHTITLFATDSLGHTSSDSIRVSVMHLC